MKIRILFIFFIFPFIGISQDEWEKWDSGYPQTDIASLLENEVGYAKSIESDSNEVQYYSRMGNYRLELIYSGERREIQPDVRKSMRNVYKLFGNKEHLEVIEAVKYEYKFESNGSFYWLSAQSVLDKSLRKDLEKGETFYLYCLFLNEHQIDHTLYNSFLISEYR